MMFQKIYTPEDLIRKFNNLSDEITELKNSMTTQEMDSHKFALSRIDKRLDELDQEMNDVFTAIHVLLK